MLFAVAQLLGGSLLLLFGGEWVVRGASRLAILAKLSPLFVGLTVVSLGTSAPEMAVSIATAMQGKADITIGNVVGSNLFNMLMIVGVSATVSALSVDRQITSFDVPAMVAACVAMWLVGYNGNIGRVDGIILLIAMVSYFAISYKLGKGHTPEDMEDFVDDVAGEPLETSSFAKKAGAVLLQLLILAVGIGALILGCDWFVEGAVAFARRFGLSEAVIGLTIVSVGTSLPELVTSVAATLKGERGIAIGNAVGSTILNILAVLGVSAIVSPVGINVLQSIQSFDVPIMIGAAVLSWVFLRTQRTVTRLEGILMVVLYFGYVLYLLIANGAIFGGSTTAHHLLGLPFLGT
ncbi:calcium/sodium antiporter [Rhodopirellula sallentina]|uniref:K+-dependent Na+/Ca+ exchanger-like protein n=1 Tax=Rhodopirellula sallentina SM41 TaxID=1263870 RepID=M5UB78_9BACT|nr:calcium/sodium antiporter [Rhodopirellula sallentina]EMI53238.1 K+-dependent Na+/Ca+ exchanger-like protein [Rhodopirellula sallentina SM41]